MPEVEPELRGGAESDPRASPEPTVRYLGSGGRRDIERRPARGAVARRELIVDFAPLVEPENLRRIGRGVSYWLIATLIGGLLVAYLVGSLFAIHRQRALTLGIQLDVSQAYGAANDSLAGASTVTQAPTFGTGVALISIPRLRLQQAVAEGATSTILRGGAGHVPGTAALGQPGNSVVVGRAHAFGGAFGNLDQLQVGDKILVLTTQGTSVYTVSANTDLTVANSRYQPTTDDELNLMTSDRWYPWNSSHGRNILAKLDGQPYTPTPQNGFATVQDGRHGDGSAWPLLILEVIGLAVTIVAATILYRRWSAPATYLITTPALLALTIFFALTGSRLLPGWA